MINYLDNYLTGPSSNHLKRKKWFRLPANILRTKPNCLPASQTIEIKTRQRKAKVPPGTCPYFNWCESFTEHTPPPEVRVPGQVPSLWLCHCADSSNDCHFFPLLLPAAPEAHQPVFWSQEFIVNLATSHAIVMQLVRLTPAGPLPSTLRAPKTSITTPSSRGSRPGSRAQAAPALCHFCCLHWAPPPFNSTRVGPVWCLSKRWGWSSLVQLFPSQLLRETGHNQLLQIVCACKWSSKGNAFAWGNSSSKFKR